MKGNRQICFLLFAALILCLCGCAGDNTADSHSNSHVQAENTPGQTGEGNGQTRREPVQTAEGSGNSSVVSGENSEIDISGNGESVPTAVYTTATPVPQPTDPPVRYQAPEFADASFHEEKAQGKDGALIDLSAVEQGYVAVSAVADVRLKFQVLHGDVTYSYDMKNDGTPSIFPIQSGDGDYTFRVMRNVPSKGSGKYAIMYTVDKKVKLEDEFQPFLRPSDFVNYSQDSTCVTKAAELAKNAEDAVGVISAVYDYICTNVDYDKKKAEDVQNGSLTSYLPVLDDIMKSKKGICFDYAALGAAMLRSQGIPTKMIFGYVSPDDVYHAWNMFYTEETGWVTVEFKVQSGAWNRLDLTFSAGGADSSFIGDGGNYADLLVY